MKMKVPVVMFVLLPVTSDVVVNVLSALHKSYFVDKITATIQGRDILPKLNRNEFAEIFWSVQKLHNVCRRALLRTLNPLASNERLSHAQTSCESTLKKMEKQLQLSA